MTSSIPDRAPIVEDAARAAGSVALSRFDTGLEAENKRGENAIVNPGDVVTVADRRAQAVARAVIAVDFPEEVIVGEEGSATKHVPRQGVAWVIDPIDGTYNFARGSPAWTTSVTVVEDRQPIASVNVAPARGEIFVASGNRALREGAPIVVSDRADSKHAVVAPMGIPDYGGRDRYARSIATITNSYGNFRRYGSAQLTLSVLARGVIDGAVTRYPLSPWDTIAGVHLVRAAGGRVTDPDGSAWSMDTPGLVASNGSRSIHDALLEIAAEMG